MQYRIINRNNKHLLIAGGYVDGQLYAFVKKVAYPTKKEAQVIMEKVFRARPSVEILAKSSAWDKYRPCLLEGTEAAQKTVYVHAYYRRPPDTSPFRR